MRVDNPGDVVMARWRVIYRFRAYGGCQAAAFRSVDSARAFAAELEDVDLVVIDRLTPHGWEPTLLEVAS